jgi:hypothetical protein
LLGTPERDNQQPRHQSVSPKERKRIVFMEVWKDVNGFEGFYKISNRGRIKSLERNVTGKLGSVRTLPEKELTPTDNGKGYMVVTLYKDGKRHFRKIHKLVAEHFIPNPENKPEVNHKDGNKRNNFKANLEWDEM